MKYQDIKELARQLRNNPTKAEKILWGELRNRKILGLKFLRQHPVIYEARNGEYFFFIPDFYCAQKKLVIELDGEIHKFQGERDHYREEVLKQCNLKILRINNVDLKNMQAVLDKIIAELNKFP